MNVIYKDLWEIHSSRVPRECVCITTNGSIRKDGCAVMGRGCALEATQRFPGLQKEFGALLAERGNHLFFFPDYRLITFPVKTTWDQQASLQLIEQSCLELCWLLNQKDSPIDKVFLPKPGCDNGRLRWETVEPVLDRTLSAKQVTVVDRPRA